MPARPQYSAGSRTATFLLTHPAELIRGPRAARAAADRRAVASGQARAVSCFLRRQVLGRRTRTRQGVLVVTGTTVAWRPFWSLRREPVAIPRPSGPVEVREPGLREWGVPAASGVLVVPTSAGDLVLAVPAVDVPLVLDALGGG